MLIVQRKIGERIVLPGGVEIAILEITGKTVRVGVVAPRGVTVLRGEVYDAIAAQAAEAASSAHDGDEGPK